MNDQHEVRAFITDPALQRRLAKYMVLNVILCRTGTNRHFATKAARSNRPSRKPDAYRNYAKANNGCRDTPFQGCCSAVPHFLPAVAVSTTHYQQLLAPPVPRSRCND
jgi:hypothetical protein